MLLSKIQPTSIGIANETHPLLVQSGVSKKDSNKSLSGDHSTCSSKSHNDHSFDKDDSSHQDRKLVVLDSQIEQEFTVNIQKKRKRLADIIVTKRQNEIVIKPHQKQFKGDNVQNFRGSKFRGISKNGSSWQILVMVNRKKKYLGTLPTEE